MKPEIYIREEYPTKKNPTLLLEFGFFSFFGKIFMNTKILKSSLKWKQEKPHQTEKSHSLKKVMN